MQKEQGRDAANEVESEGMLPLHFAAQSGGAAEIVELLLPYTNFYQPQGQMGENALVFGR